MVQRRRIHPIILARARELCQPQTPAEATLWQTLKDRKIGYKFRRQHPINRFIIDFYCAEARLLIEVDGVSHLQSEQADYDAVRAALPSGANVFSATDLPHLLLDPRYSLETLDLVGFASRTPHLPYFAGDQAKLDWLRAQGFDRLVAMKPGTSWSLYQATEFGPSRTSSDLEWDQPWAPYRDDWSDFIERLPELAPDKVTEHGPLLVVDLT